MHSPAPPTSMRFARLALPVLWLLAAALAGYGIAAVWAGSAATLQAFASIGPALAVVGSLVCLGTFMLRFVRWQALLACFGHRLPAAFSLRVYLAGIALSSTPGKVGETARSAFLLKRGVPLPQSLAAFVADRLADVIAVALLGAVAGWIGGQRQGVLEVLALSLTLAAALAVPVLRRWHGRPALPERPILGAAPAIAGAWAELWRGLRPLPWVAAGAAAYGLQAGVFAWYSQAVAPHLGLADCVAIFAAATLLGAASMVPAGLGIMDAALVVQLMDRGVTQPAALAASLAARASTLWLGLVLGAAMLLSLLGESVSPGPGSKP